MSHRKSQMWIVLTTQRNPYFDLNFCHSIWMKEEQIKATIVKIKKKKTWNIKRILSFVFLILFLLQEKQKNKNKWNFNYFGSDYFSFTESSHLQYLVSIVRRKISEWFYIEDKLSLVLFFLFTTYANGFYSVKWNIATSWTQWL